MSHLSARPLAALAVAGVILAGCAGDDAASDSTAESTEEMSDEDMDEMDDDMSDEEMSDHEDDMSDDEMSDDEMDDEEMDDEGEAADDLLALTATSPDGSTIVLGDLADRPVLVETFATWCGNCRTQLGDTQAAAEELGEDAVVLALSVETDLDPAELSAYADENGFDDVRFAVLDADGLAMLQERFGGAVLTPPSTPKFRVDADGSVSELTTGFESTDEILSSLDA